MALSTEKKVGVGLALGIVAAVALAGGFEGKAPPERAPYPDQIASIAPIDVTAAELHAAYDANEVSADDRFKGRKILVFGPIEAIAKDAADRIVVRLAAGGPVATVDGYLPDSEKPKAAALERGQKISLLCRGAGRVLGSPVLVDCSIQY